MRRTIVVSMLAMAAAAGACGGDGAEENNDAAPRQAGEGVVIGVKGLEFDPDEVTVKVGEQVRWKWVDNLAHNVEA